MIGMNCLSGIIGRGIYETNNILSALHSEIRTALRQPETGNNDGMDIGICIYRKSKNLLQFSGGKHPLLYVQDDEIYMIKGDPHPMGGSTSEPEIEFTKHEIKIDKPTMVYLFSDGYSDQFGGPDDKKFLSANLRKLLHKIHAHPLEQQKEILEKTIDEWRGVHEQTDDILVMGIRIEPSLS
jgi:serine phosphatase RsbU (regulator of sigma subunit)